MGNVITDRGPTPVGGGIGVVARTNPTHYLFYNGVSMAGIVTFDTHAFIKKMISTGMSEEQAETLATGLAEIVTDRLATKDDLALYHRQTETEFAKVRGEIKDLGAELRSEIKEVRSEIAAQGAELRADNKLIRSEMEVLGTKLTKDNEIMSKDIVIKLVGAMAVFAGLLFTALRLFPA